MKDTFWRRWGLRLIWTFVFILSIFIRQNIPDFDYNSFNAEFLRAICEAIAIAMVIALTVEFALKKEFGREVFLASIGYLLPPALKPEMAWVSGLSFLCTQDHMICTLSFTEDGFVKFHVDRIQVIENIGHRVKELQLGLGIDEWFVGKERSQIKRFSIVMENYSWPENGQLKQSDIEPLAHGLRVIPTKDTKVNLAPEKTVTLFTEFEEIYPRNGYFHMHIKYATSKPKLRVTAPENLNIDIRFTHRENTTAFRAGYDYDCPFTLLPEQRIGIRFCDKKQSEEWKNRFLRHRGP